MQNERNDSNSWERTGLLGRFFSRVRCCRTERCPQLCLLASRLRLPFCLPRVRQQIAAQPIRRI